MTYISGFLFLGPEDVANLSCGTEEETLVHILCECEDLTSLRHTYLGSFFSDPEDITHLIMGRVKEQDFSNLVSEYGTERTCFNL